MAINKSKFINQDLNPKLKQINGPINVIRLEGKINNIQKIIYIFMDTHYNVYNQTQCENLFSIDIQKFLLQNFYQLNKQKKIYDFFLEIHPTQLKNTPGINYRENYINEIFKLFKKMFLFNPKLNKVSISKLFKNIRLHYIDIRDYFHHHIIDKLIEMTNYAFNFMSKNKIYPSDLSKIIDILILVKQYLKFVVRLLQEYSLKNLKKKQIIRFENFDQNENKEFEETLQYLIGKISGSYKYSHIKKILNNFLDDLKKNLIDLMNDIDKSIELFTNYVSLLINSTNKLTINKSNKYQHDCTYGLSSFIIREMIKNITDNTETIFNSFVYLFAFFMDIYFLRRFLDKDYITNAIVYSGKAHSTIYIYFLIKFFDFKITHASYSKINDLNKVTEKIYQMKNYKELYTISELLNPPILNQCSDLTDFPKDFE